MMAELVALKGLVNHPGFPILQALWLEQITKIEEARDKAAGKGSETAWRYWAGQEKGAKIIATSHVRAIEKMESVQMDVEQERTVTKPSETIEKLLAEARGETNK